MPLDHPRRFDSLPGGVAAFPFRAMHPPSWCSSPVRVPPAHWGFLFSGPRAGLPTMSA